MSIELPEARIIAEQLEAELPGRRPAECRLQNAARMQQIGFINRDATAFEAIIGHEVREVAHRGNTVLVHFDNEVTLLIAPEYGGEVRFTPPGERLPAKHQFRLDFEDGSTLTIWIKSMGGVMALQPEQLVDNYMYKRDFNMDVLDPGSDSFTFEAFSLALQGANRALKTVLVGKDAVVVGLSNASFQDLLFRAGIHPKRRAASLTAAEQRRLYDVIRFVIGERARLGGKAGFVDVHGNPGGYQPAMGPHLKGQPCPECGGAVEKMALGGGETWYCPSCQPE